MQSHNVRYVNPCKQEDHNEAWIHQTITPSQQIWRPWNGSEVHGSELSGKREGGDTVKHYLPYDNIVNVIT